MINYFFIFQPDMIFNFMKIINFGIYTSYYLLMSSVAANKVEKVKYFSTLLGLIFI